MDIRQGNLDNFCLIGGYDGAIYGRNYYTKFVTMVLEDCILLTLSCGKYRFNKLEFGEITEKTHLSRPAVSHHLQILKEAGIINMYREGTKNYYYVSADETIWNQIRNLFNKINEVVEDISERDCNKSQIEIEFENEFI